MVIGIDYRPVIRPNSRRRGIGVFTRLQIEHLLKLRNHEFLLYTSVNHQTDIRGNITWRKIPHIQWPNRLNWILNQLCLSRIIGKDRLDLYHATEVMAVPSQSSSPLLVTVHDLIPLVYWDKLKSEIPVDYRFGLRYCYKKVRKADQILTISESAKIDISSYLGIEKKRISVIYPGYNPSFSPMDRDKAKAKLGDKYGLHSPFLFYVGGSDRRKNLKVLVKAYSEVRKKGYEGSLVLAGETFLMDIPEIRSLRRTIDNLNLQESIFLPGYVDDRDLPSFYSACDLFVFPSLYEGFGLPVLEAMACAAPVLASNKSSIPEVGGQSIEYFLAEEIESLVESCANLLQDSKRLDEMRSKGPQRASKFSWKDNAISLTRLYKSLVQ